MRTVKGNIKKNHKLQKLLDKSKQRKCKKQKKTRDYCKKSIERRETALGKEYPLGQMRRGRMLFPLLLFLMRCRLGLCGVKIRLLNTFDRKNISGPVIFIPTHIGKFDIEVVYACIKTHALLLSGTEDRMHGTMDGWFLGKCGVNYVDRANKKDRANSVIKMQKDLEHGFDLLWFIEGTWNLSENRLLYPVSWASVKVAGQCNATIVPIGLNQSGKEFYVKFGEPVKVSAEQDYAEAILDLKDVLATLKWDVFEYIKEAREDGFIVRSELKENYWLDYMYDRISEWPIADLEEEMKYVFQPKGVYDAEEVFAQIRALAVKRDNAFLLDKRISGRW